MRRLTYLATACLLSAWACIAVAQQEIMDPAEAAKDPDFHVQGEYLGEAVGPEDQTLRIGAQVIALGEGRFQVVVYRGGRRPRTAPTGPPSGHVSRFVSH